MNLFKTKYIFLSLLFIFTNFNSVLRAQPLSQDYKIQPGDVLNITVFGEDELLKEVRVSERGKINYPLLGEVVVGNKTVQEIISQLTELLEKYLVNPQVMVFATQFGKIYIYGKVNKPGALDLSKRTTLLESLTLSGGLTDYANPKKIMIIRNLGNKKNTITVDLNSIIRDGNSGNDIQLYPDDIVIVPERIL